MIPAAFRTWRKSLGFNQREAAEALGVSVASVMLYEAGRRRDGDRRAVTIPKTVALACAAVALGIREYGGPE